MIMSKEFFTKALASVSFSVGKSDGSLSVYHEVEDDVFKEVDLCIDSRALVPGELFFALQGTQSDGHEFIVPALENGASGIVISDKEKLKAVPSYLLENKIIIQVADTYQALIALAKAWRQRLTIPMVAITGSVGKTSTKEMTRFILEQAGVNVYASFKNQNNLLGLCLNILKVKQSHEVAVFEVGINERGEMEEMVDILRPTLALITCIAHAHGQGLGSLPGIFAEKRLIFKHLTVSDVGIIFGDQDIFLQASYHHPIAKFGFKTKNQVQARKVCITSNEQGDFLTSFVLKWYGYKETVTIKGNHRGMVSNVLAASTIAYLLRVPFEVIVRALPIYNGVEQRFEIKKIVKNRGCLISDCYNANPESMKAALLAFNQMETKGAKIAVLGDMLELGHKELYWHRQIGRVLRKMQGIDRLILVGDRARHIAQTAPSWLPVLLAHDWQEAGQLLEQSLIGGGQNLVLVKASHGVQLGKMVETFVS